MRLLIASLAVALSSPTLATPIVYDIDFDVQNNPNITDGGGSFIWHDDTHAISDFMWDFGEGRVGGFLHPWTDWQADYLFGMMTGTCWEEPTAPCFLAGIGSSSLFGWPLGEGGTGSIGMITTSYFHFSSSDEGAIRAFYTIAPRSVPEPGTLLLLSSALAGMAFIRRWRAWK